METAVLSTTIVILVLRLPPLLWLMTTFNASTAFFPFWPFSWFTIFEEKVASYCERKTSRRLQPQRLLQKASGFLLVPPISLFPVEVFRR